MLLKTGIWYTQRNYKKPKKYIIIDFWKSSLAKWNQPLAKWNQPLVVMTSMLLKKTELFSAPPAQG
jgi:hypothetical protein